MTPKQLFLAHLGTINEAVGFVSRRHALKPEDAEDLASAVRLHLIADDYRVLAEFRGESRLETYLGVVVQRCWADFRRRRWGRWRISAAARRLGPAAVILESLVFRDELSTAQARRRLADDHEIELSDDEITEILAQLPVRPARREVAASEERPEPSEESSAEREIVTKLVRATIADTLARLHRQDRLLLRLHFEDGLPVTAISRSLGVATSVLRRRLKRSLSKLRIALLEVGVVRADISQVLVAHLDLDFEDDERQSSDLRPSLQSEPGAPRADDSI